MKIGIDVMGGDYAPKEVIKGIGLALKEISNHINLVLFGKKDLILKELQKNSLIDSKKLTIIDCSDIITMDEHAIKALKNKPDSSINKGISYLASKKIDGFASAGNTGAVFASSYYSIKPIPGVLRPCISAILPKESGGVTILLDVGANADCKAETICQFGHLGSLFAKHVYNITQPKIALLNLGSEESKGNLLAQTSYKLMSTTKDYTFVGNIEGSDLFNPDVDVVVCDGFTGNIVLKQAESFYNLLKKRNINDSYFERLNYENYGGTPILGLDKTVIIGHGISNEIAIKNMIQLTEETIKANLCEKFKIN